MDQIASNAQEEAAAHTWLEREFWFGADVLAVIVPGDLVERIHGSIRCMPGVEFTEKLSFELVPLEVHVRGQLKL